jgi:hypothetical protein
MSTTSADTCVRCGADDLGVICIDCRRWFTTTYGLQAWAAEREIATRCPTCGEAIHPDDRVARDGRCASCVLIPVVHRRLYRQMSQPGPTSCTSVRYHDLVARFPEFSTTCQACGNQRLPLQLLLIDDGQALVCGPCAVLANAELFDSLLLSTCCSTRACD